jgi:hypothetical protein
MNPNDQIPKPPSGPFVASGAWDRFRTWLIGIGIGTVIGGMLILAKYQQVQSEKAQEQAAPAAKP